MSIDMIETYDDVFDNEWCENFIKHFEHFHTRGKTYSNRREPNLVQDTRIQYDWAPHPADSYYDPAWVDNFYQGIENCYLQYRKQHQAVEMCGPHSAKGMSVQKTGPHEGYHGWHSENMDYPTATRLLVYTLYLNDVEEGGETEFLYQGVKVKPKAGRVCIWPAALTHLHRGNPIYTGSKYLITGWVTYDNVVYV
jgi:hypothetical protein